MSKTIFPFLLIAFAWLLLGSFFIGMNLWSGWFELAKNIGFFLAIWAISLLNLYTLTQVVFGMNQGTGKKTFFWGLIKLFSLGILVGLIYMGRTKSLPMTLILGISTCLVVPVVGGMIWSKDLKNAL